jgi:hypothetical protein
MAEISFVFEYSEEDTLLFETPDDQLPLRDGSAGAIPQFQL